MSIGINSISSVNQGMDASIYTKNNGKKIDKTIISPKDEAVIYETTSTKQTDKSNQIAKLQAESDEKVSQFKKLVEELLLKQGKAVLNSDDFWKTLASGEYEVDEETANKAAKEISEDGYWGVEQTSERIFSFAKALSGDDPDKMNDMLEAFKEGFDQATSAWGKTLPELSQKTYDAVLKKFEDYK